MHRRGLLASARGALTAGCASQLVDGKRSDEYVRNVEFSVRNITGEMEVTALPNIEFWPASKRVVVTGALWVGSGPCYEAKLDAVSYDETNDTLDVAVKSSEKAAYYTTFRFYLSVARQT